MKKLLLPFVYIILFAFVLSCEFKKHKQEETKETKVNADSTFNKFKNSFIEEIWRLDPSWAAYEGKHEYDSLLTVPDSSHRIRVRTAYTALRDTLMRIDTNALSVNNRIDYKMMENYLNKSKWYDETFRGYEWNPATYNVGNEFAIILTGRYASLEERLRALLNKMKYVAPYYAAAKATVKDPTIQHTDLAIAQSNGVASVFGASMEDSLNKSTLSESEKKLYKERMQQAKSAVQDYVSYLTDIRAKLTPQNARSFRIGQALYTKKFEYDIVSGYSASDIYNKALMRKKELHEKMTGIAKELWPKYMGDAPLPEDSLVMIKQVIDSISLNHVKPEAFIEAIEQQIPELVAFVNNKGLLTQDPGKPLVVRKTPDYMDGIAGASISAPGPYDKNANTYYNVTPPTTLTPAQAESYLREYNYYILQILNIHEAIPGHYTQLIYSNKAPSIIKSIFGNGAMVEGWAVYTELMMLENGYKNSPEMWLMYYKWNMRVTMNTILDYSIHVLNTPEEHIIDMLKNEAFQEDAEATGKWKRATLSQVQLCSYYTGFQEIYDLREELKKKQGDKFDLKKFHEEFLSYGSAPVKFIRELMLSKADFEAIP